MRTMSRRYARPLGTALSCREQRAADADGMLRKSEFLHSRID
jgi:hypothetical protein